MGYARSAWQSWMGTSAVVVPAGTLATHAVLAVCCTPAPSLILRFLHPQVLYLDATSCCKLCARDQAAGRAPGILRYLRAVQRDNSLHT